jgi:hypothetical protein
MNNKLEDPQFNLIKELADMHNKAIGKHQIILAKMPKRKKDITPQGRDKNSTMSGEVG